MGKLAQLFAKLTRQCCLKGSNDTMDFSPITSDQRQINESFSFETCVLVSGVQILLLEPRLRTQVYTDPKPSNVPILLLEIIDGLRQDIGTVVQVTPKGLIKTPPVCPLARLSGPQSSMSLELKSQLLEFKFDPYSSSFFVRDKLASNLFYLRVDAAHALTGQQTVAFAENLVNVQIEDSK